MEDYILNGCKKKEEELPGSDARTLLLIPCTEE